MRNMSGGAERLRELVAEATPGPWIHSPNFTSHVYTAYNEHTDSGGVSRAYQDICNTETNADAALIALAPELAALVADMAEVLEDIRSTPALRIRLSDEMAADLGVATAGLEATPTQSGASGEGNEPGQAVVIAGLLARLDALLPDAKDVPTQ